MCEEDELMEPVWDTSGPDWVSVLLRRARLLDREEARNKVAISTHKHPQSAQYSSNVSPSPSYSPTQ
ncbi:unnamed protein product [Rodentolepis nana]|uniref:Uncharacterized protein n=1 Tax=Rodentolepis nana TaxID=102285 RepID=A0A0R3TDM1_RODNA|nr:unnamed protein product [Rodentolepis nana]